MRKIIISAAIALLAGGTAAAQEFSQGDLRASLSIGVGCVDYTTGSKATFDQHVGVEWGVKNLYNNLSLGVGFLINNSGGASRDNRVNGVFNYTYYNNVEIDGIPAVETINRTGVASATARVSREDFNIMPTVSLHYSPLSKLDTYLRAGIGIGAMCWINGDYKNEGVVMSSPDMALPFPDLEHVQWAHRKNHAVVAVSAHIGATYYFNEHWGLDGQFGIIGANCFKKSYGNSYSSFALGASYKC